MYYNLKDQIRQELALKQFRFEQIRVGDNTLIKRCRGMETRPKCPNTVDPTIPGTGWCRECYNANNYLRDLEIRAETDPSIIRKDVNTALEKIQRLLRFKQLTPIQFAGMQEILFSINDRLQAEAYNSRELQEAMAVGDSYRKQLLSEGALEFESQEEMNEVFKIAKQVREQMQQQKMIEAEQTKQVAAAQPTEVPTAA